MMSQKVTLVKTKENNLKQQILVESVGSTQGDWRFLGKPNKNYILEEKSQKTETCWESEKNQFEL